MIIVTNNSINENCVWKIQSFIFCFYFSDLMHKKCHEIVIYTCPSCCKVRTSLVTFCVSRRRRKMYCGHASVCVVSVCLSAAVCPHYCMDPHVTWGSGRGCPLVAHYWADLQSVHGLHCYGNIMRTLVTSLRLSRDMTT